MGWKQRPKQPKTYTNHAHNQVRQYHHVEHLLHVTSTIQMHQSALYFHMRTVICTKKVADTSACPGVKSQHKRNINHLGVHSCVVRCKDSALIYLCAISALECSHSPLTSCFTCRKQQVQCSTHLTLARWCNSLSSCWILWHLHCFCFFVAKAHTVLMWTLSWSHTLPDTWVELKVQSLLLVHTVYSVVQIDSLSFDGKDKGFTLQHTLPTRVRIEPLLSVALSQQCFFPKM